MDKLAKLCEIEGMEEMELLEQGVFDSICPGICMNEGCDYTTDVEPDCDSGWCEACESQTVKAATVIAGII